MKKLDRLPLRRALISVYDKTNLAEFARGLHRGRREAGVYRFDRIHDRRRPVCPSPKLPRLPTFPSA